MFFTLRITEICSLSCAPHFVSFGTVKRRMCMRGRRKAEVLIFSAEQLNTRDHDDQDVGAEHQQVHHRLLNRAGMLRHPLAQDIPSHVLRRGRQAAHGW